MREEPKPEFRISDLESSERPRERLARLGAQYLKTEELMAILLRTGVKGENAIEVGQRLLHTFGDLLGIHRASFEELRDQHGLGPAKAAQIKAAVELGSRLSKKSLMKERKSVSSPEEIAGLYQYEMSELQQETLKVVLLDTRNHIIDTVEIYRGSVNSSQVRVAEIFTPAIRRNLPAIIVLHNHPSGDPTPSPDDIAMTRAIIQAGKLLDVDVLDHIVIARQGYVSLKQRGLGYDQGER
ncbi:DNA repair protein RadC [Chloroflexota bacterium]